MSASGSRVSKNRSPRVGVELGIRGCPDGSHATALGSNSSTNKHVNVIPCVHRD
jgi:hypothetical protein